MWVASGAGRLSLGSVASTTHHPGGDVCETLTKSHFGQLVDLHRSGRRLMFLRFPEDV